jgi:hypothetical protein
MFILYALLIGLVVGLATGGRLERLGQLQFRWGWVFLAGLAVQLVLFSDQVVQWIGNLGPPVYVGSTLAVTAAIAANYRLTGMPIVLLGAVCNLAAIVANRGYMPASPAALAVLGKGVKEGYSNSALVPDPQLPWLTDVFALPTWLPASNVFSVGDVLIGVGVAVVIVSAMRRGAPGPVRPSTDPNVREYRYS